MNAITDERTWQVYLKRNWGVLILGVLFFSFGMVTNFQWGFDRSFGMLYFANLFPGLLLITTWFFAAKYQKRRWVIIVSGLLITLLTGVSAFYMNIGAAFIVSATTPITEVPRYTEIRQEMGDSELTRHFPLSIPENAENVRFEYLPKFLQGGSHFQLRMRLPQAEVSDLLTKFRSQAKYKFYGGDTNDHANLAGGVPTTFFFTNDTDDYSFPDDYEILVLNAEPGGTPDFQWNHGYSYGVVISLNKSEIIYWAEYW